MCGFTTAANMSARGIYSTTCRARSDFSGFLRISDSPPPSSANARELTHRQYDAWGCVRRKGACGVVSIGPHLLADLCFWKCFWTLQTDNQ